MTRAEDIAAFYSLRNEGERLEQGLGRLEAVRTIELLSRCLPPPPAVVCDVGGAHGYYARWLTNRGYTVHLIDVVPAHVDAARHATPAPASACLGDARELPWPDRSADAVLLMGPLYHLVERADRVRSLAEAKRVVRPDGVVFGVVIPRWASTLIGMQRGWTYDDAYAAMVRRELTTGHHVPPAGWSVFMEGFFHSQDDLDSETRDAGLNIAERMAVEGPAWLSLDFDAAWNDPPKRERILELSRLAERDREVIGASPHVAFVARPS